MFIAVNASLIVLKRRAGEAPGAFEVPAIIPAGGILVCTTLLAFAPRKAHYIAMGLLAAIAVVYFLVRPKGMTEENLAEIEEET